MPRKKDLSAKDLRARKEGNIKRQVKSELAAGSAPRRSRKATSKLEKDLGKKSPFRQSLSRSKGRKRMPIGEARARIGESFGVSGPEIQKFLKGFSNTKDPRSTEGPTTRQFPRRR